MSAKKNSKNDSSNDFQDEILSVSSEAITDCDNVILNTDLSLLYKERREMLSNYMTAENIFAIVFEDSEDKSDASIRYFTGHPSDALLIVTSDGKNILIPWDENLAAMKAHAESVIPYTKFNRVNINAVKGVLLPLLKNNKKNVVELTPSTPYPTFLKYVDALEGFDVRCRENSIHEFVANLRSVKDFYEIACTKKAAQITCRITDLIEKKLRSGAIKTESDVALLIEKECRSSGCERTGFDTLAAGPSRSFAIHAFPGYTSGLWGSDGLSILDYGVVFNGYTSDATITIAKGNLSAKQEKLLSLVQKAADSCLPLYKAFGKICDASNKADEIFSKAKLNMPHGLGHGTGLEIHEYPFVSHRATSEEEFIPGMIVTLEPGLYDPKLGGVRLENDVLICEDGNVVLTNSRIIRL